MASKKQHLYVLQCKNYVKIGVSKSPDFRVKELQTGNPFKITLLLFLEVDNAFCSEKYFHSKFSNRRGLGEWFEVNDEITKWVKDMKNYEYMQSRGIK